MRPEVQLVPPNPALGFNFPYLLRLQATSSDAAIPLLVEPNNSGHASPKFDEHLRAAEDLIHSGLGGRVSTAMGLPLLMPVFPREPALYTHSLGRTTLQTTDPLLRRLDLQLLAMIADARVRLKARGLDTHRKVLLTGFSASAMFVTRFAALHPDSVLALAAGGLNAFVILPVTELQREPMSFHLGVADIGKYTGRAFQALAWRNLPQYLFMGADDTNDAVLFDDSYSHAERDIIFRLVGREMPRRWESCRKLYAQAEAKAVFVTYAGLGHGTNGRVHADVAAFLSVHARQSAV